jgi:hypothetical protein
VAKNAKIMQHALKIKSARLSVCANWDSLAITAKLQLIRALQSLA